MYVRQKRWVLQPTSSVTFMCAFEPSSIYTQSLICCKWQLPRTASHNAPINWKYVGKSKILFLLVTQRALIYESPHQYFIIKRFWGPTGRGQYFYSYATVDALHRRQKWKPRKAWGYNRKWMEYEEFSEWRVCKLCKMVLKKPNI